MSGGARRPFLLAAALREAGANVFVVAPSLPDTEEGCPVPHPHRDPPPEAEAQNAANTRTLRDHARNWLLWPDPDIRWASRAADEAARAYAASNAEAPDWIITTSPPESVHAAGAALKKRWPRAKWAADFRDHWLDAPHRRERLAAHRRFGEQIVARRWLQRCDLITAVDGFIADEMKTLGARNVDVLAHFAPPTLGPPASLPNETVNIVHAGSIALSDPLADIDDLLRPFADAARRNDRLRLHFVGRLSNAEMQKVKTHPAATAITTHGVKPYRESLTYVAAADGLAYVASTKGKVPPSKIVEYLSTDKPVIACGDGPWRDDPRVDNADPTEKMARLQKGDVRRSSARPPSAKETADRLLSCMRRVS